MRYLLLTACLGLSWSWSYAAPTATDTGSIIVVDDRGRKHQFSRPPKRVVSMAPAQTEIVYHLGQGFRLVGRTQSCDYPPAAQSVPSLGHVFPPRYEKIIAFKPDVVL